MIDILKSITSIEFIEKWQTLFGVLLGSIMTLIVTSISSYIKNKYVEYTSQKEAIRRVEISFTQSIYDILIAITQLEGFIQRAQNLLLEIDKTKDQDSYSINSTNFQDIIHIYFDEELIKMKFKSHYIHNKILIITNIIRTSNDTLKQFKYDFEKLLNKNEKIVFQKMMSTPRQQCENFFRKFK